MSPIDLQVEEGLETVQQVKDQDGNGSELYLSESAVAVATDSPDSNTSLTVYAKANVAAITSQRPSITGGSMRTHWKAQSLDSSGTMTEVWRMLTGDVDTYGFILRVNGTDRLMIDEDGNMTLDVASLKITGLQGGAAGSNLVIDSDGNVGVQ